MRLLLFFVVVLLVSTAQFFFGQTCGGKERWAVKDGTDATATRVDLTQVIPISVHDLVNIHQPHLPPTSDNTTRIIPDETHLYRVDARLVKWKEEAGAGGDSDFHLVLTDDTLQYTDEHAGIPPTGHSFIGEIPSPDCLSGSAGAFGTTSPFLPDPNAGDPPAALSIKDARIAMQQQFPNAGLTGGWNDAGGIPVEIVGVGFFDRAHQQAGRAPNNIEIHPILAINFNPGVSPQPAPPQPVTPQPVPQPPVSGPQWEYKIITATSAADLVAQANAMGSQGWEMAGAVLDPNRPDSYVGFLKRRK
jgi:hypothetical protein